MTGTQRKLLHNWMRRRMRVWSPDVSKINVDMKTSTLKPILAKWVISAHEQMSSKSDLIVKGFEKAGI